MCMYKSGKYVKDKRNHDVLEFEGKRYSYDGLYNLIKDMKYKTVGDDVDYVVKKGISLDTNKPCIIAMFQESTSSEDWRNNFLFFPKSTNAYKDWEHKLIFTKGFFDAYQSARDEFLKDLFDAIDELPTKDFDIVVCGWSYGASITQIVCEDIYYHCGIKPIFIGYEGANPCSNKHTRKYVESILDLEHSVMFWNQNDVVNICPPFPFGRRIDDIVYRIKPQMKFPFLFYFIRTIIDMIKNTEKYHTTVDEAIIKYMPNQE